MSNMKQYNCQQCNIACSSELFDQSDLNWKCCWLNSDDFVLPAMGNTKKEKWPWERKQNEKCTWQGSRVYSAAFLFSQLVHTLCLCINSLCIKGLDIWLWYPVADFFGRVIRVMLFDRAVTQGCWIKRHFVFFSSLLLSQPRLHWARIARETDRGRQK